MAFTGAANPITIGGCETFLAETRLVVAPVPGSFEPVDTLLEQDSTVSISEGDVVGHIVGTGGRVAVTSPFSGSLDTMIAWPNERLQRHQRVLSMREVA